MASPSQPPVPTASPVERIQQAYAARAQSDYIFSFWTAFGWTLLTCGIYGYYILYQLVRRSRDHNRRRLELLDAATALAWDRASSAGRADELRPRFESIGLDMGVLRAMTTDFRDPVMWIVIALIAGFVTGVGGLVVTFLLYIFLDQDLVKHDKAERSVEAQLSGIYSALGADLPAPTGTAKEPYNYVGRVIASIFSIGI